MLLFIRTRLLQLATCSALALGPCLVCGQVIFSDGDFLPLNYVDSGAGNQDVRFNYDYSQFDYFDDEYLIVQIPPSPRGGGSTTGVLLSANADRAFPATQSFSSIIPVGVSVGTGTDYPNYKLTVDVFNSTAAGIYWQGEGGPITRRGSTTHAFVGLNQQNGIVQVENLNAPTTGNLSGQGLRLAITGDATAIEDYLPIYGGATYADSLPRGSPETSLIPGRQYFGTPDGDPGKTGLAGQIINDYWQSQGFEIGGSDPNNNLVEVTGDDQFRSPDPNHLESWFGGDTSASGVQFRQYYAEHFKASAAPLHYHAPLIPPPAVLVPTEDSIPDGVLQNRWATHELYWVDGTFTYVMDGIPVLQITPDSSNVYDPFSTSGAPVLGFWDRFGNTISLDPEGANFVVYDNLEISVAEAADVPDMTAYLLANGYLGTAPLTGDGDFDGDGYVDGFDFLMWQRGESPDPFSSEDLAAWEASFGTTPAPAFAVPEPTSVIILLGLAVISAVQRRRIG